MPQMFKVLETHPVTVEMMMSRSDDHWIEIATWLDERSLDVIWTSNTDTTGIAPIPFLRYFCFKEEDREAAMVFKLTWGGV